MREWVKMPSGWICQQKQLRDFNWRSQKEPVPFKQADYIAALMLYIIFLHHANDEVTKDFPKIGFCRLTYSELEMISSLSRSKISAGIKILQAFCLVRVEQRGRENIYEIVGAVPKMGSGWAKLPAKGLYSKDLKCIPVFQSFHLRTKNELNALKLFLLFVAFRDNTTNETKISYDKISEYTGIDRGDIRRGLSLLINHNLINMDNVPRTDEQFRMNIYRVSHIDSYRHRGTSLRLSM